jgi:hypothetical protein
MPTILTLFERYWKLRRHKYFINRVYKGDTQKRLRLLRPVIRAMTNTRQLIEQDIYLFPQDYRHIPD